MLSKTHAYIAKPAREQERENSSAFVLDIESVEVPVTTARKQQAFISGQICAIAEMLFDDNRS
jgi:hypothetical protein